MPNEPSIKRDLKATADLLDALQNDPRLLEDADFIRRLSILRQKHEETTNFLARKVGAPELRTSTSSTSTTSIQKTQKIEKSEVSYHCTGGNREINERRVNVPIRVAPPPPVARGFLRTAPAPVSRGNSGFSRENSEFLSSSAYNGASESSMRKSTSSSTSQSTVREILSKVKEKYELLPESLMVTTISNSRQNGNLARSSKNSKLSNSTSAPKLHSEIVEESFLSDALSTTREVPTIVDEVVEISERPKIAHVTHIEVRKLPHQQANYKVPEIRLKIDKKRSKSMQNVAEPKNEYIPQTTVPKPFQLSLRKSTGNTYAKKFMDEMMEEKKKIEEEDSNAVKNTKFRAKPVPKSTYIPTNVFATEQKYVEAMRKKIGKMAKAKFDAQNEMVRSKSESNLASIKPLGYVPPSTYISPIPVKPNARSRSATTRSAILIQEATTPKGIKSHRHTSNLTHNLRHGRCKIDVSTAIQHRRVSPPDFDKIHAKINEEYRKTNSKPSTVPIPFKFESRRSQSAHTHKRHQNCQEKEPEQFAKHKSRKSISSTDKQIPSTHAAQLREELSKSKIQKEKLEKEQNSRDFWKEDNRKRISSFLGARSKTDEDIAIRTRRKIQQQQETTQEYMRQLAQMKQRVLNGPLIMEKQTALAQEHRLKRKFEARMKTTTSRITTSSDVPFSPKPSQKSPKSSGKTSKKSSKSSSRRNSEISSGGGTFVVEKEEYSEDFDEEDSESGTSSENSESSEEGEKSSEEGSESDEEEEEH